MKLKAVSGIMLTLLLIGMLTLAFNIQPVRANGTIYIRADGSVAPDTAPISSVGNITYTFTGNIYDFIVVERDNIVIDGAGYTLQGAWGGTGIDLTDRSNATIKNMEIKAFSRGIQLSGSSNNIIQGNNVTANTYYGIRLRDYSNNNSVSGNNVTNNYYGIWIYNSSDNSVYRNDMTNNEYGVRLCSSSNNKIYHNNFLQNWNQVYSHASTNVWDDGYPSGGNYWSDYTGVDVKSGLNHDQSGSDGIGDTAYVAHVNNIDHYPLMHPWGSPPPPSYTLTIYSSPTGVTFTVDGVSRTTFWSGTYSEGTSVSLVIPENYDVYIWSHWLEDGDTNGIKTVTVDTDLTLTGVYAPAPKPVGGKATPINIPMNKPETPTLWIWLATIIFSLVLTVVYVKKRKRHTKTDS